MGTKRILEVDASTGEVLDGVLMYVPKKRQNGFGKGWAAMAQDAMDRLAEMPFTGADYRVLMKLLARLDFENLLSVSQSDIAKELGMHRQHVQRSVKTLIKHGVVIEGPRVGQARTYRLNPHVGWRGSAKGHVAALDEYRTRFARAGIRAVIDGGADTGPTETERERLERAGQQQLPLD